MLNKIPNYLTVGIEFTEYLEFLICNIMSHQDFLATAKLFLKDYIMITISAGKKTFGGRMQ